MTGIRGRCFHGGVTTSPRPEVPPTAAHGAAGSDPRRPGGALALVAAAHVLVAVAAVAVVTSMVVAGTRPDAEIAGVLGPVGALLAVPVLAYLVLAILATNALLRGSARAATLAVVLGVVDVVVGLTALTLGYAALADVGVPAVVLVLGLLPLALGVLTLVLVRTQRSRAA